MLLQLELLIHLNKNDEGNDVAIETAKRRLEWARKTALNRENGTLTSLGNHLISSALMLNSNMASLNMTDMELSKTSLETTSDLLKSGTFDDE